MSNKSRGKYFEEKVSKMIRDSFKIDDRKVHRNIGSGVAGFEFCDVATPYDWLIECKYRKDVNYNRLLKDWDQVVKSFFKQAGAEKETYIQKYNKIPLVTIVLGSPYAKPLATIKLDNFYHNSFIEVKDDITKMFTKCLVYNKSLFVVNFDELLQVIRRCIK